jgi:hypothetical protein
MVFPWKAGELKCWGGESLPGSFHLFRTYTKDDKVPPKLILAIPLMQKNCLKKLFFQYYSIQLESRDIQIMSSGYNLPRFRSIFPGTFLKREWTLLESIFFQVQNSPLATKIDSAWISKFCFLSFSFRFIHSTAWSISYCKKFTQNLGILRTYTSHSSQEYIHYTITHAWETRINLE